MSNAPNNNQPPGRRNAPQIRGPQSALTNFLASHNISAAQIRQDANARRAAAVAAQQAANPDDATASTPSGDASEEPEPAPAPARRKRETKAQVEKRKQAEKAVAKIKAAKKAAKRKYGSDDDDDEDAADSDGSAWSLYEKTMAPMPDQMDNCDICEKRFTVTAYSRAGPNGGLLCPKCSSDMNKDEGNAKKKRKAVAGQARRKMQSNLLDGVYPGAKSLVTLCIETLARNVDMAENLGDLPPTLVDKLAGILSKRRLMNTQTLNLFLRPGADSMTLYDCGKLSSDDFIRIFQLVPTLQHLSVRNAVQFKNVVMDHLLSCAHIKLETLSLHGANLVDDERWNRYLKEKGGHLKALKVYWTDGHFGDEQLELVAKYCHNLTRLKITHNQKVTDKGLSHIAKLTTLQHLTLEIYNSTSTAPYVEIIKNIGSGLETLCLSNVKDVDNSVLTAIHDTCFNLTKLRIAQNEVFTDEGFTNLFTDWTNKPLFHIDLHECRHMDSSAPRENPENIGLCSSGFQALMKHSRKQLRYLNIHSCRHIKKEAFEEAFEKGKLYPELKEMDISFCPEVDDFVVGLIFKAAPNLKTLKVFGCFGVAKVKVPKGKILIGVPNALGMQIEGMDDRDEDEGRII